MIINSISAPNFNLNYQKYASKKQNCPQKINSNQISFEARVRISEGRIKPEIAVELYEKGFSQEDIAEMYNCDVDKIHKVLYVNGIDTRGDVPDEKSAFIKAKKILKLYRDGYTQRDIAKMLNYSPDAVHLIIVSCGIDTRA